MATGFLAAHGHMGLGRRGGARMQMRCFDERGHATPCFEHKGHPPQDASITFHRPHGKLPISWHAAASQHGSAPAATHHAAKLPSPSFLRKLQQFAGLANLAVGFGDAASQKALNVAGVASQLYNFYGPDGVGIRSQLGAMPAPGGLGLMLLKGPLGMPGPLGPNVAWVGNQLEAAASSVNPLAVQLAGTALQDIAASNGAGSLVGATGLAGLGLGTGSAVTAVMAAGQVAQAAGQAITAVGDALQQMKLEKQARAAEKKAARIAELKKVLHIKGSKDKNAASSVVIVSDVSANAAGYSGAASAGASSVDQALLYQQQQQQQQQQMPGM
ncbi:hypothetical protein OEZ86_014380 [Tetradesmus obliquus]|nr:hypothetical protein OEZ86_014380 [Tetradesmus obliquus]